jgi:diguanylate cyclase (GGDEF)-like protein
MLTDITQQKKNALALETLASQDGLTGLLNRRTFMDLAKVEHQRSKRYEHSYAIILLDLDHFKRVNDTYGHQCGDHALQEVAYRIKKNLRGTDFVGRYGGEEFIVLLPETKQHVAALTAEKIRSVVSNMAIQSSQAEASFCVTLSAGVALFTSEGEEEQITLETVLSRADKMLYVSKKDGRNRVSVWPNKKSHSSDSIRSG